MQCEPPQGKVDPRPLEKSKDGRQQPNYSQSGSADGRSSARVARRASKVPQPSSREPAVSRDVLFSFRTNHAARTCSCLDERSMSSGGAIQAVRQSSLAVVRQHDSPALNRDSHPRRTAHQGPHGSGLNGNPNSRPLSELSAQASRSARLSPNTLLVRAWRSLIELRIDDALATLAQFEEIGRAHV